MILGGAYGLRGVVSALNTLVAFNRNFRLIKATVAAVLHGVERGEAASWSRETGRSRWKLFLPEAIWLE